MSAAEVACVEYESKGEAKERAYKLFSTIPVASVEVDDQASAVKASPLLKRRDTLHVFVAGLVEHIQDLGRSGTDSSTGDVAHRLGNVMMGSVEED